MTIILSYYKCRDDWKDEGKHLQRWYAGMLEKKCGELKKTISQAVEGCGGRDRRTGGSGEKGSPGF